MTKRAKEERTRRRMDELKRMKAEGKKLSKFSESLLANGPFTGKVNMRAVLK